MSSDKEQTCNLPGLGLESNPKLHKQDPVVLTAYQSDMLRTNHALDRLVHIAADSYDVCRGRLLLWYAEEALPSSVMDDLQVAWPETHDRFGIPFKRPRHKKSGVYHA